jgi:hypothetical protein
MADVTASDIEAYVTSVIVSDATSVADVAPIAAQAAVEIASLTMPPSSDGKAFMGSLASYRQATITAYLGQILRQYAQDYAGTDASVAFVEVAQIIEGN